MIVFWRIALFGVLVCLLSGDSGGSSRRNLSQEEIRRGLIEEGMRDLRTAVRRRALTVPLALAMRGDLVGSYLSLGSVTRINAAEFVFIDPGMFFVFAATKGSNGAPRQPDFIVTRTNDVWRAEWLGTNR